MVSSIVGEGKERPTYHLKLGTLITSFSYGNCILHAYKPTLGRLGQKDGKFQSLETSFQKREQKTVNNKRTNLGARSVSSLYIHAAITKYLIRIIYN